MLITYRSILAFLNVNKTIIISINKFGEQYLDIAALVLLWSICLISSFFLIKSLKEEGFLKKEYNTFQKELISSKKDTFFDLNPRIKINNKTPFIGYISKSGIKVKHRYKEKK